MAARKNRGVGELPDSWKEKIKAAVIVGKLVDHIDGINKLDNSQIRAADILLKKVVPDLSRAELTGKDGAPFEHKDVTPTDAEILAQYNKQKGTK